MSALQKLSLSDDFVETPLYSSEVSFRNCNFLIATGSCWPVRYFKAETNWRKTDQMKKIRLIDQAVTNPQYFFWHRFLGPFFFDHAFLFVSCRNFKCVHVCNLLTLSLKNDHALMHFNRAEKRCYLTRLAVAFVDQLVRQTLCKNMPKRQFSSWLVLYLKLRKTRGFVTQFGLAGMRHVLTTTDYSRW